jgi:hypothetical protein
MGARRPELLLGLFSFKIFRRFVVARVEQNVAWASSLVNYFEQKASAGTALAFTSENQEGEPRPNANQEG